MIVIGQSRVGRSRAAVAAFAHGGDPKQVIKMGAHARQRVNLRRDLFQFRWRKTFLDKRENRAQLLSWTDSPISFLLLPLSPGLARFSDVAPPVYKGFLCCAARR